MRIFISYSSKDKEFVLKLTRALSSTGFEIWLDTSNIPPGQNWSSEIHQGLVDCELMLLIVSPDSMKSQNVAHEWQYFMDQQKPIIPLKWLQADLSFQLSRLQYIDFENQDFESAFDKLIVEIDRRLHLNNHKITSDLPQKRIQPLRFLDLMHVIEELEKAVDAVQEIGRSIKRKYIRSSLMWFDTEDIYTVAATEGFEDFEEEELRLRLKLGQGIIGQFWSESSKDEEIYQTRDYIGEKFESLNFSPEQKRKQISLLRKMSTIILYRISNESGTIGILSVEIKAAPKSKRISTLPKEFWKLLSQIARNIKNQIDFAYPLPYFKFQQLKSIVHMARLLPPYTVPVQAAIFWWNDDKKWLYMICGDQRYTGPWITETETWADNEGVIGWVKKNGKFKADNRIGKSDKEIQDDWNMDDRQFKTVK